MPVPGQPKAIQKQLLRQNSCLRSASIDTLLHSGFLALLFRVLDEVTLVQNWCFQLVEQTVDGICELKLGNPVSLTSPLKEAPMMQVDVRFKSIIGFSIHILL